MGANIKYYKLVGIFGGAVSEIQAPDEGTSGEFFVKLCPTKDKRMYSATQYYLDENSLKLCQKDPEYIDVLRAATELE